MYTTQRRLVDLIYDVAHGSLISTSKLHNAVHDVCVRVRDVVCGDVCVCVRACA